MTGGGRNREPKHDPRLVEKALGQNFDEKIRLAKVTGLISNEQADSLRYLHIFRNTSYHRGLRHEGILHSLALFYFINACELLKKYEPIYWSSSSRDVISHRAMKYLGEVNIFSGSQDAFKNAWERLTDVAKSMPFDLINDLARDMLSSIKNSDHNIQFLADESPEPMTRRSAVLYSQAWPLAFTEKGKAFARKNNCPDKGIQGYVDWLVENYQWKNT